jgi:glyoxylase-like metal-dependent hydrolase (beta-lactamase superfamily II)
MATPDRPIAEPFALHRSRRVGRLRVHALHAGELRLDGGAMFGVVPRPLWERKIAPDARNRIGLAMRCLLIEHDVGLVLIDTGLGNKEPARFQELYGVENAGAGGRTRLEEALARLGHAPEDVALVINTHLHFDHAGGNTYRDADGRLRPSFPNARYVVPAGEYGFATHVNERTAASYLAPNFVPLHERGVLDEVAAGTEVVAGLRLLPTPGHTPHHTSVLVESAGETLCFLGDVVPTSAHLPLPWIMGYDVAPLVTLESKRALLARASAEGWTVVFEHDAAVPWGRVVDGERGYALADAADTVDAVSGPG